MLDVDSLLQPNSDEFPSGEALEYDMDFLQLEILARGRSEQRIGDAVSAGEEPDWAQIEALSLGLVQRSKDLRIGVLLARALLHGVGFEGLDDALRVLAGYVGRFWDTVHPVPDADEDDTMRVNALAALSDPAGLLGEVRRTALARSPVFGTVSLRDIQVARRELLPSPDAPELGQADIEATFRSAGEDRLAATAAALLSCGDSIDAIAAVMAACDSTAPADQLEALRRALRDAWSEVDQRIIPAPAATGNTGAADTPLALGPAPVGTGEIRGRSDVVARLELICRWYAANEPASPVPVLLERARRLVSQDFLSLLADLAPAGLEQFRLLAGMGDDAA
jgi:type VI secretion system protein ImpA